MGSVAKNLNIEAKLYFHRNDYKKTDGTPKDLIAAFPDGANTTCQVGDLKMTTGEAGKLLKASDFSFKSAKAVADVIVKRAGL